MSSPIAIPEKTLPCDRLGTLLIATYRLIERDRRSRTQLSHDLGIPLHWLNSFMQESISAPSVNRIQYIYETLSGKTLL